MLLKFVFTKRKIHTCVYIENNDCLLYILHISIRVERIKYFVRRLGLSILIATGSILSSSCIDLENTVFPS